MTTSVGNGVAVAVGFIVAVGGICVAVEGIEVGDGGIGVGSGCDDGVQAVIMSKKIARILTIDTNCL